MAAVPPVSTDTTHVDPPAAYDDINVRTVTLIGVVGSALVFVAIVVVQVLFFRYQRVEEDRKVIEVPNVAANAVLATQRERLAVVGAGDGDAKTTVPIVQAMRATVAAYRTKPRNAGGSEAPGASLPVSQPQPAAEGTLKTPAMTPAARSKPATTPAAGQDASTGQEAPAGSVDTSAATMVPEIAPAAVQDAAAAVSADPNITGN